MICSDLFCSVDLDLTSLTADLLFVNPKYFVVINIEDQRTSTCTTTLYPTQTTIDFYCIRFDPFLWVECRKNLSSNHGTE